jgi:hypothetical protein
VGRPSLYDDLRAKRIVDAIGKGLSRTAAAAKGGISRSLLLEWLARGRAGEQPFVDLLDRVRRAECQAEEEMVGCIRTAALDPRYWQAARWWLEVCRPADYAARTPTRDEESERAESDDADLEVARSVVAALESKVA